MKKKYLKIILITFLIVFLIGVIVLGIKFATPIIKQKMFFNKIENIEYDVKITKKTKSLFIEPTGATSVNYDVINLEERKLYSIGYSGFMGDERLESYGISSKELTQDEIQEILKLSNMESEEVDRGRFDTYKKNYDNKYYVFKDEYYWVISYKGRKIELNKLPFSEEILKIK